MTMSLPIAVAKRFLRFGLLVLPLLLWTGPVRAQEISAGQRKEARRLVGEGEELLARGEARAALAKLDRAQKLDPQAAKATFLAAACEVELARERDEPGRLERARDLLGEVEKRAPRFGGIGFLRGLIGLQIGDYREAVIGFTAALGRGYRPRETRVRLAESLYRLGEEMSSWPRQEGASALDLLADATRRLQALLEDDAYSEARRQALRELLLDCLVTSARLHFRLRNFAAAETVLSRLIRMEPENHLYRFLLGQVHESLKRWERALVEYRAALAICADPDWLEPLPFLGSVTSALGRPEEALAHFESYLNRHPDSWEAWFRLGRHQASVDRLVEAAAAFGRCIEIDHRQIEAMGRLVAVLRRAKRPLEAAKWRGLALHLRSGR